MSMTGLLLGLIPLIIFAIIDTYATLNVAIVVMFIATILECLYSYYAFGGLDSISLLSIGMVVVLCILSYWKQTSIMIKLKPALLSLFLGVYFLFFSAMGQPLLNTLFMKYQSFTPPDVIHLLETSAGQIYFGILSLFMGIALVIHAAWVAYAGIRSTNVWWCVASSLGLVVMIFFATICATIMAPLG